MYVYVHVCTHMLLVGVGGVGGVGGDNNVRFMCVRYMYALSVMCRTHVHVCIPRMFSCEHQRWHVLMFFWTCTAKIGVLLRRNHKNWTWVMHLPREMNVNMAAQFDKMMHLKKWRPRVFPQKVGQRLNPRRWDYAFSFQWRMAWNSPCRRASGKSKNKEDRFIRHDGLQHDVNIKNDIFSTFLFHGLLPKSTFYWGEIIKIEHKSCACHAKWMSRWQPSLTKSWKTQGFVQSMQNQFKLTRRPF